MKNLKISTKLIISIVLTSIIMSVIGIYGVVNLRVVDNGLTTMYLDRVIPLEQLKNVSDAYAVNFVDAVIKAKVGIHSWDEAARELVQAERTMSLNWNAYLATKIEGEERRLVSEATELRQNQAEPTYNKALDLLRAGKDSSNQIRLDDFIEHELYAEVEPFTGKLGQLIALQLDISKEIKTNATEVFETTQRNSWVLLAIGIGIGFLFSLIIINSINKSIQMANEAVLNLEKGNLTYQVNDIGKDEIGELLLNIKQTIERLKNIVKNITIGSNNIANASIEMSGSSQELSQGTSEQASSTEEVSSSMEEMAANIQQNADNSAQTHKITSDSLEALKIGSERIFGAMDAMKHIAEKISIVNDIAFQTNILALNASVEAARAGEHGRGFSVVAEEVRSLAQSSKEAAKDISVVVKSGLKLADESGVLLKDLLPQMEKTAILVKEISFASNEQNSGVAQINNAIQSLNQVVQQSAASAEEMASTSEELSAQAEQLNESMEYFDIGESVRNIDTTRVRAKKTPTIVNSAQNSPVYHEKKALNIELNNDKLDGEFEKF
ncbi:MAG: methyl-accepting chemotaxis protein [Bacteroidales bacterium]|nr:methyl-accepting chemotaxis protein [Bacteroidales bacterium]